VPAPERVRRAIAAEQMLFRSGGGEDVLVTPLYAPDLYLLSSWRPATRSFSDMLAFGFAVASPLLMWIIAITVGWLAIEAFVSRPLQHVEELARGYVRGSEAKLNEDVQNAPDEIRSLARTLAAMARTLRVREQRLAEALREERALLREVHHRVKNNLQVVASLLNIQARAAHDTSEAWGLARAHDRVQLLSIVHQRIYSSGEVREIRLDEIARDVARHLTQSRGGAIAELELDMHIEPVRCDVDHAVPMGFLLAESISNALDHAPPAGREKFQLRMTQDEGGAIRFAINAPLDPRIPVEPDAKVRLVEAFARQLGAQVARQATGGRYRVWAETPPLVAAAA
jgi:two-component system, sensor histidine kinase PdtaS